MIQVFNVPLSRGMYDAIRAGDRVVSLPNTPHYIKMLYKADGLLTPKPYKRVNLRLGVSGEPTQYEVLSIGWRAREHGLRHEITLGREITPLTDDQWLQGMHIILNEIIWGYLEASKAYAVNEQLKELRSSSRAYDDLFREFRHITQYSTSLEYRKQVQGAVKDFDLFWKPWRDSIWDSINKQMRNSFPDDPHSCMRTEAMMGMLVCRVVQALHRHTGGPKDFFEIVCVSRELQKLLDQYAAPYETSEEATQRAVATLLGKVNDYRQYSRMI